MNPQLLSFDPGNVPQAIMLASMLRLIQMPSAQANIDTEFEADMGIAPLSTMYRDPVNLPTMYWGVAGPNVLILLNGVENVPMATALWNGYVPSFFSNPAPHTDASNPWIQAAVALAIDHSIGQIINTTNLVIAGYSGGGAIAYNLAVALKAINPRLTPKIVTFGSPKPGDRSVIQSLAGCKSFRLFTNYDPVPLIPPTADQLPYMAILYGLRYVRAANNYCQPSGGYQIDNLGDLKPAEVPAGANQAPVTSLASWLFALNSDPTGVHALNTYISDLQAYLNTNRGTARPNVPPGAPATTPNATSTRQTNAATNAAVNTVFLTGQTQNVADPTIPAPQLFQAIRSGRIWYTAFAGSIISIGPTKRRARALARFGNEFLRRLQTEAVVDPSSILAQFQTYFQAAADPTQGFNPVLNTSWPQ